MAAKERVRAIKCVKVERVRAHQAPAACSGTARRPGWGQAGEGARARHGEGAAIFLRNRAGTCSGLGMRIHTLGLYSETSLPRPVPRVGMSRTRSRSHRTEVEGRSGVLASWYDRQGPAADVLQVGELPDPQPGAGEVRVRVTISGANPGDTKKRRGWLGSSMSYSRVIPHSDAAGFVDSVGVGVDRDRIGQRVWVFGAQSYRPFGTAAQYTVVPEGQAVPLPPDVSDQLGASLGIPGITAHRAVFGDGPVEGTTVLVHGVLGGVGSIAAQLARWGGATVIGTVVKNEDLDEIDEAVRHRVALDVADPIAEIRRAAPDGVDRIVEVSFSDNADLDA